MKSLVCTLVFIILCGTLVRGQMRQKGQIKGHLTDKSSEQPLADASVALLYAKDSTMAASAFTDKKGAFTLDDLPEGTYKLYITFLGYQPLLQTVSITPEQPIAALGAIPLQKTGVTLDAVEITEIKPPIRVKKDTLEFNAGSFKTRQNAVVEELLKKLPGVEVDKDGNIKAQGETVKKILVDGKPFFGNDPKLATKNLPAEIVDKIQLIDKKSDQAQFSGINDGQTEKAINITIKKDRKKGMFGQVSAGAGTSERFAASTSLNRFREDQQLSFIGSGNNVNNQGYTDISGLSMGGGRGMRGGMGNNGGNGISRNWTAGLNYSQDLTKRLRISGSYFYNNTTTENERNSARQNLLPDTTYYYNQRSNSISTNANHNFNMRVEYEIDSTQSLIVSPNLNYTTSSNFQDNLYESLGGSHQLVNNGTTRNAGNNTTPTFAADVLYRKKFHKTGRTFSANLNMGTNNGDMENYNHSNNLFIQPNGAIQTDSIDQRNDITNKGLNTNVRLIYTEPLAKDHFLEFTYAWSRNYSSSDKLTYDFNAVKGIYDRPNDSLSNSFENTFSTQQAGVSLRTQKKTYDYSLGLNVQYSDLDNNNISLQNRLQQHTFNFFPSASFSYAFNNNKRLRFFYRGGTQQPSVNQLQPVPDNSNPLYIQLGNPDLKPSFNNNFSIGYNTFNPSSMQGLFANISMALTSNKIINANYFDSLGRQVSQPVNVNGAYNINGNLVNTIPLKREHTSLNATTNFSLNRDVSYINNIKGITRNFMVNQGLSFNYAYRELFDFSTNGGINYNGARYSVQKDNNRDYFNYFFSFDFNVNLPLGFNIGFDLDYTLNTGLAAGYNQDVTMLNAYISKSLFRNKQALIKLQGFDLLNQNVSISRNVGENYIEDVQARVLQRFCLLSFSYFLNRFGGGEKGGNKNMRMRNVMPMQMMPGGARMIRTRG
ncbi:Outer membrane receptor proteins, mostly Fe transport [Chitinophaga rupis]|uniref:Outer membrane receptor proteins, mostly Fe transport n=1 Tax=Chitinophaga rupis TaxID=573321 RepID=A0A1H7JUD7_9BACT|nr:outer membrane beta-barrel family protein [Chitinophaga rupis]SEK78238.1 Outer membrane receptor proteins, mostly Fe transport [Chitinophaga rupis]